MNAESEGEKMYLDKWRVAIRNLKNSLFSYPNTAQSCFPDPITDDTVFYCVQGLVYGSQKFPDGKFIRSSPVTSVYSEDGKLFAKTINNVYELKTPSDYFDCDIAENAAQKTGSSELAETAKMQREKLRAQLDKFFTICQRLCDNEQADVANELPEDTLVICYYGTDPHGNKMFYKNEDMVVPVFAYVTVGLVIDSVGLAESEEKLDLWDTLGRYYIDSELMEFYDCDTKNLIICNLTNSPIYVTIYESSAAMLCMPNTAKIASRKVKEK